MRISTVAGLELEHEDDAPPSMPSAGVLLGLVDRERRYASALDLGTGCGYLALELATFCDRVEGTDVDTASLEWARQNAARHARRNVTFRAADLFADAGRFDLIVSNPPFVISPERDGYRSSRPTIVGEILSGVADHLAPGGIAYVLGAWSALESQPWTAAPHVWLGIRRSVEPLSVGLLRLEAYSPETWAATWTGGDRDRFRRWVKYLHENSVERIHYGAVVVHADGGRRGALVKDLHKGAEPSSRERVLVIADKATGRGACLVCPWETAAGGEELVRAHLTGHAGAEISAYLEGGVGSRP